MPLTTRNADQMINSQEELKLFMGQLVNAFFTVQGAKGKKDEDLDRLSDAVQKKFNEWNKLDAKDFSLPEIRRELKNEVLLPIETYLDKFKRPVEVRQQLRPLELSLRDAQEKVQKAEETYEEIDKNDTPRRVAQMGKINALYRTELVPAETAYNNILKEWDHNPDNKQAQLRRELENTDLFAKYTAHVGDGPNLRLRIPKTAAESLKLSNDYLYGLGNAIQAHSTGPNTLHSSRRGGVDPELRAILAELSSQDLSDYARSVHASGGEYDASKDPAWAAVRRFSGWMERNYGTTLHQNILEEMDRVARPADLIDYSAPTYGKNNMPKVNAYKKRETTPELFSKETLEAAPAGIGEKLSGKGITDQDRVYHETQLYGAFSKVLRDAEAKAAGERLGFARVPDQFKEERTLVKAADKLMTAPGERIERLESLDRQEKDIEELNAMTPEIRKSLENSRVQARAIAGDPKALFEGLSEVMHSPATDPQFLEILKESFMDNRALFEAEKDFLPEGFMAELRKGAKDRGLEDAPAEEKKEEENLNRINII